MSTIYLRRTYMRDLPAINRIIEDAKNALKTAGSPQWQDGHPDRRTIINDITHHLSWALVVDEQVVGVATMVPGPEESYQQLQGGAWSDDDNPYLTIHRVAIGNQARGQHLSTFLFSNLLTIGQERGYTNFHRCIWFLPFNHCQVVIKGLDHHVANGVGSVEGRVWRY